MIKSKRSRYTTWRVLGVFWDGTLVAEQVTSNKYRRAQGARIITRPEAYQKVERLTQ